MKEQSLGQTIARLRKEKGMTQLQLAERMGVTDKAVSKWERDLSSPDLGTMPKLAEAFGLTVDELMQGRVPAGPQKTEKNGELVDTILKALGVAMGVGVTALSALGQLPADRAMVLLGIGLTSVSLALLRKGS